MKTIAITILLLIAASSATAQCGECYLGAWNWDYTDNGDGTTTTPAESGVYVQLQFLADGSFIRFENMEIVHEGQWSLSYFTIDYTCYETLNTTYGDQWVNVQGMFFSNLQLSTGLPMNSPDIAHYSFIAPTPTSETCLGTIKSMYR